VNRGRRLVRDAAWTRLIGGAGARQGPGVSDGVREGERKVGQPAAGRRHAGPDSTMSGGAV
jgi:hypothetical protein